MTDTVQLTYRLFLCLLYVVLPQLWQLFSEFVRMVVALIQEHRYLVEIPLLVLFVILFVTLWLKLVAESARRRINTAKLKGWFNRALSTGQHGTGYNKAVPAWYTM